MLEGWPILSIITFAPLAGAAFILLIRAMARGEDDPMIARNARWLALFVTSFVFAASVLLILEFQPGQSGFQFLEEQPWLGGGVSYRMGVDGISAPFIVLTAFLTPLCILASWSSIKERVAEYMIAFLVLETLMIGVFCALDLVLFYLFFEGGLIPMFIIIGVWGGANRVYAAFKFFLYTLLGSVLMLVAVLAIYIQTGTTDIARLHAVAADAYAAGGRIEQLCDDPASPGCGEQLEVYADEIDALVERGGGSLAAAADVERLVASGRDREEAQDLAARAAAAARAPLLRDWFPPFAQGLLWLAFFASFAVKLPMWPVHTWLPDAHVEAPTAGSVILAGVLLKMGGYGFLRFSLPLFPDASHYFAPLVFALSVIAIVYTSLVAFRQVDIKKLIAYSSVAHMGFVTMGIFSFNEQGLQGAMFQMISHGVISGALFLCVGVVYDRMHTREIAFYGGLVNRMPAYAMVFMLFTLGNVGLPGTSGFVGEFLSLAGAFQASTWVAVGAASGVILSAVYALTLYRRVVFGEITNARLESIDDMVSREALMFLPLALATLALGFYPKLATDLTAPAVESVVAFLRSVLG